MTADHLKNVADTAVIGATVVGSLTNILPTLAAILGMAYTVMRIVQEWPKFVAVVKGWFK